MQNTQSMSRSSELSCPTAVVHLEYDVADPPPRPEGKNSTRFICLSDTHSHTFPVPAGDVLLHSGDLTGTGTLEGFETTMEWLYSLPHKHKIIIAGNHDLSLHDEWYKQNFFRWSRGGHDKQAKLSRIMDLLEGRKAKKAGIVYLEDESYAFECNGRTWSVYGSPWTPYFYNWAFNYCRSGREEPGCSYKATDIVSKYPKTDILLTHGPPQGVLDRTLTQMNVGCELLAERLQDLRPKIHLFGHIHEAHGAEIHAWKGDEERGGVSDGPIPGAYPDDGSCPTAERTIFVNGANWPMGGGTRDDTGRRVGMGEGRFCPVIIDLFHESGEL